MLLKPLPLALAWTALLMIGLSIPGTSIPHQIPLSADKYFHVLAFAMLAILWLRVDGTGGLQVILLGALFAVLTEVYQHVMPINRSFDWYDVLADMVGLVLGLALVRSVRRIRKAEVPRQL